MEDIKVLILTIIVAVLFVVIVLILIRAFSSKKESGLRLTFITFGCSVIGTGQLSKMEILQNVISVATNNPNIVTKPGLNIMNIIVGLIFILLGIIAPIYLNDKYYILNIHGESKLRVFISEHIKSLGLTEFKIREREVNFINYFNRGKDIEVVNNLIIQDIKQQVREFVDESKEYKKALTALGPIPYTVYAGTLASKIPIDDYIDYDKTKLKYTYLNNAKYEFDTLVSTTSNIQGSSDEVVLAVSTTEKIKDNQLSQFEEMKVWHLYLNDTKDNAIKSKEQATKYVDQIMDCINEIKREQSNIKQVNLVMCTQPIVSFQLGQRFAYAANRIPRIVVYHYKFEGGVSYPFGIVVTEIEKGKLVQYGV